MIRCGPREKAQGRFTGSDGNDARLESSHFRNDFSSQVKLFTGNGYMLEEGFSFWRQCDPAMGADEEFAAQFTFQAGNGSGNIGLIAGKDFRRFGKTFEKGGVIEDAVIIISHHRAFLLIGQ